MRSSPGSAFLTLPLPECCTQDRLLFGDRASTGIGFAVHPEVPAPRQTTSVTSNVDHEAVERRHLALRTPEVERLHESRDDVRLTAIVQVLRSRQLSGLKHEGIANQRTSILSSIANYEIDRPVHFLPRELGRDHGVDRNANVTEGTIVSFMSSID